MRQVKRNSVHLVVTSPPYWNIKNYGSPLQIGYGDRLTTYIKKLRDVWGECVRVLKPGCRLCINIGDQYIRADGRTPYQIVPLHAYIVNDIMSKFRKRVIYLGSIIWQKIPTTRTSGGASVMGSYGYPRNGYVSYNYEYIAIFKKIGPGPTPPDTKVNEKIELDEWRQLFNGIWDANEVARLDEIAQANEVWRFNGARQVGGIAIFPDELPARLLRMFTFQGDTVLDPFLGSGTTTKVAFEMGRNSIGYEIGFLSHSKEWQGLVKQKIHYYDLPQEKRDSIFRFGSK
jgi:site-specific DNA-methyltransferase (adenine-specific)